MTLTEANHDARFWNMTTTSSEDVAFRQLQVVKGSMSGRLIETCTILQYTTTNMMKHRTRIDPFTDTKT